MSCYLLRVDAMAQLNLLKYCKASSSLPQVVLPCPDGLLSREVPSIAISAANKEVKEVTYIVSMVIASCNSCIYCKWVVYIFSCSFCVGKRVRISSCHGNHHPYICGIPHVRMKLNLQTFHCAFATCVRRGSPPLTSA